eukprot:g859.t1
MPSPAPSMQAGATAAHNEDVNARTAGEEQAGTVGVGAGDAAAMPRGDDGDVGDERRAAARAEAALGPMAPLPDADDDDGVADGADDRPRYLNVKLALKLVFLVFLTQQGNSDRSRLLFFSGMAFLFYLYQTGILGLLLGTRGRRPQRGAADGAGGVPQSNGVMAISRDGGGIFLDLYYTIGSFFLSLHPSWRVAEAIPPLPTPTSAEDASRAPHEHND